MAVDLLPGDRLGPFVLVEPIGTGAMGIVWRATDPRLERDVALKILATGALAGDRERRRFRTEALALSRLSHPNVAAVYSFETFGGLDVLAMEFISGPCLDPARPRTEQDVAQLGLQLAEGLAAAHAAGVVHLDLKPANLRLARDGRLKILDFGIARLSARHDTPLSGTESATATMTTADERTVAGTLPYMAPEQLRGDPTDARTDIWSAGVVLYELATGTRPFHGETATHTIAAIMGGDLKPASARRGGLSPAFDRIVQRALQRDPARRFASAAGLADALRPLARGSARETQQRRFRLGRRTLVSAGISVLVLAAAGALLSWRGTGSQIDRPVLTPVDAVAVLPFADEGGSPDTRYLADEVPGAIIDALGQVPGKKVIARSSSFRYRKADVDPRTVAKELGVTAILTGRVRVRGGEVIVGAELVDSRDATRLWGGSFSGPLAGLSALPQTIAGRVADSLRGAVRGGGPPSSINASESPEAYRLYLRGRYEFERWDDEAPDRALRYYREALEHDPRYAQAWAGIGEALAEKGAIKPELMRQARDAVGRALAIEPELAEAHAVLGFCDFTERHWADSERELRHAVKLNSNLKNAQHWLSHLYLVLGRFDEALAASIRYVEIDPLSPDTKQHLGFGYLAEGRYEDAARTAREALKTDPTFQMAYENLFCAEAMLGRGDEAIRAFFARHEGQTMPPDLRQRFSNAYATGGLPAFLRALRDYYRTNGRQSFAEVSIMLGDEPGAVQYYISHAARVSLIDAPLLPRLLNSPRYPELRRAFGVPEHAEGS